MMPQRILAKDLHGSAIGAGGMSGFYGMHDHAEARAVPHRIATTMLIENIIQTTAKQIANIIKGINA